MTYAFNFSTVFDIDDCTDQTDWNELSEPMDDQFTCETIEEGINVVRPQIEEMFGFTSNDYTLEHDDQGDRYIINVFDSIKECVAVICFIPVANL